MTKHKGNKDYPEEIKREAIQLYLEEKWPPARIKEKLSLIDEGRVPKWARQYQNEGEAMFAKKKRGRPKKKTDDQEAYIAQLEMEVDLLKKFHAELRQISLAKRDIGSSKTTGKDTK